MDEILAIDHFRHQNDLKASLKLVYKPLKFDKLLTSVFEANTVFPLSMAWVAETNF